MDKITKERRSANMAAIKSANTAPEMVVRRALFRAGLRYRLHDRQLPGRPDIVFASRRLAVFVQGCFWHGCEKCVDGKRAVKSNTGYWRTKIAGNRARDMRNRKKLSDSGWQVEEIWECECREARRLAELVTAIRRRKPSKQHSKSSA